MSQAGTISISGGGGGAITSVKTANATPQFVNSAGTATVDFSLSNLVLGTSLPALTVATKTVGMGFQVFNALTQGSGNTAIGYQSSIALTLGTNNVAVGSQTLIVATTPVQNVAIGASSLGNLTTSIGSNTAVGFASLNALTTGSVNIGIGVSAGINYTGSESSNIVIGNPGVASESDVIRIGTVGVQTQCYLAGVLNTTSGQVVNITAPGAYPYTTLITDYVILVDTSSPRTIIPLGSPITGTTYRIKDNVGSAGANNITISPSGKNIDGSGSYVVNTNYGSVDICYNGTQWNVL